MDGRTEGHLRPTLLGRLWGDGPKKKERRFAADLCMPRVTSEKQQQQQEQQEQKKQEKQEQKEQQP